MAAPILTRISGGFIAFGYEALSITTAAATACTAGTILTSSMRAHSCYVSVESGQCRFRYDLVSPTVSQGHLLQIGESLSLKGYHNISQVRFIAINATTSTLRVTYEGGPV